MKLSFKFISIIFSFLLLSLYGGSLAADCWLGERFGIKIQSYSTPEGNDQNDRELCREACQTDMSSALKICYRLSAPYVNNVEFGCFYKSTDSAIELLLNPPADFFGCTEMCECPQGKWYEAFRRQCVEPTGSAVPDMPNGDKGGGYFVKDGYLFKDAGEAACRMLPSGAPTSSEASNRVSGVWTPWMNIDQPSGRGDMENLVAYIMAGKVCTRPIDAECRTITGISWLDAGQVYTCNRDIGGICTNYTQEKGNKCLDYEVRFLCP